MGSAAGYGVRRAEGFWAVRTVWMEVRGQRWGQREGWGVAAFGRAHRRVKLALHASPSASPGRKGSWTLA